MNLFVSDGFPAVAAYLFILYFNLHWKCKYHLGWLDSDDPWTVAGTTSPHLRELHTNIAWKKKCLYCSRLSQNNLRGNNYFPSFPSEVNRGGTYGHLLINYQKSLGATVRLVYLKDFSARKTKSWRIKWDRHFFPALSTTETLIKEWLFKFNIRDN